MCAAGSLHRAYCFIRAQLSCVQLSIPPQPHRARVVGRDRACQADRNNASRVPPGAPLKHAAALRHAAAQAGARAQGDARGRAEPPSWKALLSRLQQLLPKYLRNVYDRRALKVATWRRDLMDERRAAAAASGRARPARACLGRGGARRARAAAAGCDMRSRAGGERGGVLTPCRDCAGAKRVRLCRNSQDAQQQHRAVQIKSGLGRQRPPAASLAAKAG